MSEAGAPTWDDETAGALIGKTVLVGLTHLASGHEPERQEQMHGIIVSADPGSGFRLELWGKRLGDDYWLPPDVSVFHRAQPGTYKLRSTGEEVENPDLVCSFTISPRRS